MQIGNLIIGTRKSVASNVSADIVTGIDDLLALNGTSLKKQKEAATRKSDTLKESAQEKRERGDERSVKAQTTYDAELARIQSTLDHELKLSEKDHAAADEDEKKANRIDLIVAGIADS